MERKYPTKMFWLFVITNFLFHFFYLSVPGITLCIVGIWIKSCLWIGLAILGLDFILSIVEQSRIRKAAVTPGDHPEFNELMDAFCGPNGPEAVRKIVDAKIEAAASVESQEDENRYG